jgi:hypothetical protein
MIMPNAVKEHRGNPGYHGGQADSLPVSAFRDGQRDVVALYQEFTGPGAQVKNWEFRKKVIKLAYRLFTGRTNWFIGIDDDRSVQQYNYEFILDTVRYIATGSRRISIHSWPDLIGHNQPGFIRKEHSEVRNLFKDLALSNDMVTLIQRWCAQKGGVDDLMLTLNILFGDRVVQVD